MIEYGHKLMVNVFSKMSASEPINCIQNLLVIL